jgi:hypothetical protein
MRSPSRPPARSLRPRRARLAARSTLATLAALAALLVPEGAPGAHVGSPEVLHEGQAGPYPLVVVVRPPEVIPGIAEVDVRVRDGAGGRSVDAVTLVPVPLVGEGAELAPRPDRAERSPVDPALFSGRLWIMERGGWRVRVHASGRAGTGDLAVPVAVVAARGRSMTLWLGLLLAGLMALLAAALASIVAAAVGEAQLPRGEPLPERVVPGLLVDSTPAAQARARTRVPAAVALGCALAGIGLGLAWWRAEARFYRSLVYRPLDLGATLSSDRRLVLTIAAAPEPDPSVGRPSAARRRRSPALQGVDDLMSDHGHLMHLFMIRLPAEDAILHLHPERIGAGRFRQELPAAPAGRYRIFADVVHASGLPETLTTEVELGAGGGPPAGDDATGGPALGTRVGSNAPTRPSVLPDGTRVTWAGEQTGPLPSRRALDFRFLITGPDGRPVTDLVPYMGMAGHAVFLARDLSVFAHLHPSGSVAMASMAMADPAAMMAMHAAEGTPLAAEVAFPYGLPHPGPYRIFVQFRRGATVETAVFDIH